ncbi:MAG: helix-turn-helix domain-containing protein [Psychrosphaera sp.]|nr:helix-turn-helix domain-containing protein [Psychrosphaera sp.]
MEKPMNAQLENLTKIWPSIKTVFSVPHNDQEYHQLVETLDTLVDEIGEDEGHQLSAVMETIGKLIVNYEEQNFAFNEGSPIDALKYLMKEHGLKQSDLKEIGSQGVVSEILTGKRELNIDQIKRVSQRFNVSPLVFI